METGGLKESDKITIISGGHTGSLGILKEKLFRNIEVETDIWKFVYVDDDGKDIHHDAKPDDIMVKGWLPKLDREMLILDMNIKVTENTISSYVEKLENLRLAKRELTLDFFDQELSKQKDE